MNRLKALFVDDEKLQHQVIERLLEESDYPVEARFFHGQADFFFALEDHLDCDVIFLDVEMPEMDGLEMAHRIRQILPEVALVFITAYSDYAIKGYEVSALDYLLKPVTRERLEQVLDKVHSALPEPDEVLLLDKHRIRLSDIYYIEAQGHRCLIGLADEAIEVVESLSQLTAQLPPAFVQTHRAYWVNLAHVFQVDKMELILDNQQVIPLSRRQAKAVRSAFVNYYQTRGFSL